MAESVRNAALFSLGGTIAMTIDPPPEPSYPRSRRRNSSPQYPTLPGADGPDNLRGAVLAAADAGLRGAGCLVVLGDEIHSARTVRKSPTTSPAAFTSPACGPVARIAENQVRRVGGLPPRGPLVGAPDRVARVGPYTVTLGDDGALLDLWDGHCDGLLVVVFGVGHVPERLVQGLTKLVSRIPVVLASRIGNGPVLSGTYGISGSEKDSSTEDSSVPETSVRTRRGFCYRPSLPRTPTRPRFARPSPLPPPADPASSGDISTRAHELTGGRTFGITFDHEEDFFEALSTFCRDNGLRQGYIPSFIGAFAEAEIVGACEKLADPDAPVWAKTYVTNRGVRRRHPRPRPG
ncbi:PCC domain-containing protein [Streptomyces sp. NPDC048416]|uniref:PCC domain-containing protein n=1 Tax=Streptomyces sp. NPDC048416 TaxID=3365546 RepID=UPI003716FEEE